MKINLIGVLQMSKPRRVKLAIRQFDTCDDYSWAVFYANDVSDLGGRMVQYGQADPIRAGMCRKEADNEKTNLEKYFR